MNNMNVFAYLRVSSRGQIEGDGFERQGEVIKKLVKEHSLVVTGVWKEEGVSGTVEGIDRPAFAELLAYVDQRADLPEEKISAIVVERMDRLARDLMVSELLLAECRKRNLQVFSADQGALIDMAADGSDPTRTLIRQIMGALAQWEKSMLVKKLKSARDRIRASGKPCEGNRGYGSNAQEKNNLGIIRQLQSEGFSHARVAQWMNESERFQRNGKPWTKTSIRMLTKRHSLKTKETQ